MNNELRALREDVGWSQGVLADRLDVSRQTVNALETGRYDPSLPLAFRIARLFGLPIEAIFRPDDETAPAAPAPAPAATATPAPAAGRRASSRSRSV